MAEEISERDVVQSCMGLCDLGFATYEPSYYAMIQERLYPFKENPKIQKIMRMAEGGPTLSSKRFAYPHIKSYLQNRLDELGA